MINLIQSFIDFIVQFIPRKLKASADIHSVKLVAHRGCHENGATENTLAAFQWCIENKIWGMEFDIQFTADNIAVIHHDQHCGRLFDRPDLIIEEISFQKLQSEIPDIPSFQEVLIMASHTIHLMIEVKSILTAEQNDLLKNQLSTLTPGKDYHLISLNADILDSIQLLPKKYCIPITTLKVNALKKYALENGCAGIAGHYLLIPSKFQNEKLKTGVGYIASKNSLKREINQKHEWLFTDRAASSLKWLSELQNQ